jgi:DNA-binding NarL/FixJ family response regulator
MIDLAHLTLTPRQGEVLNLLLRGWSNKEIGAHLGMTERTVKSHLRILFLKAGISGTVANPRIVLAVKAAELQQQLA